VETAGFAIVALALVGFGLVSGRVQKWVLTPPMVFVALGYAIGPGGFGIVHLDIEHGAIHTIAEITLVMVLFSDAARIDLALVKRDHDIPPRLLLLGMPLTIGFGIVLAMGLFPFSIWEAALIATILAPTDAALGQAVISSKQVPVRIRQALNIESGLNDGIALPVLVLFLCVALAMAGQASEENLLTFAIAQVTLGPLVGLIVGYFGAKAIDRAVAARWMAESFQGIISLGLALSAFALAEIVGGNGFIGAFIAGITFGNTEKANVKFLFEFAEAEGQLLTLAVFAIFGAVMLPMAVAEVTPAILIYALLSLTLIRMLPVAVATWGLGLNTGTSVFLGWFGPRGLASILFALVVIEESAIGAREEILLIAVVTVGLSVFLHGLTAQPGAVWYGRYVASATTPTCPENKKVSELPTRLRSWASGLLPDQSASVSKI